MSTKNQNSQINLHHLRQPAPGFVIVRKLVSGLAAGGQNDIARSNCFK
jgi:hypothetical protein